MLINEEFFKENILFQAAAQMQSFLEPLKSLDIAAFAYDRTYRDGTFVELHSCANYEERYYRDSCHTLSQHSLLVQQSLPNGTFLGSWLNPKKYKNPKYLALTRSAGLSTDNLVIVQNHTDYVECFRFRKDCHQTELVQQLFSQMDVLQHFIQWFKWKAHDLLLQINQPKHRFLKFQPVSSSKNRSALHPHHLTKSMDTSDLKRIYLRPGIDLTYLTKREIDILDLLTKGKTLGGVALQLGCTQNTMEWHMKRIKEKLNSETLFTLGLTVGNMEIAKYLFESRKKRKN